MRHATIRRPWVRAGFIMIFTMVAVAVSGYLLVESAPDFSNYALLLRSQELDEGLTELRRAVASQPYCLYRTAPDDLTEEEFLRRRFESLTVSPPGTQAQPGHPPVGPEGSDRATFLSTVPRDPYLAAGQWYDPTTQQGVYWSRSYNLVRDPTFANLPFREAYVEDSHDIFFAVVPGSGKSTIWKINPLGYPVPTDPLITDSDDVREPQPSPDGTRLLYQRQRTGNSEIWAANAADGQMATKITSGTGQVFDTPRWTPQGDQVLYRNVVQSKFEVKGLSERTRALRFPFGMDQVYAPAWSPNGRYLAYIAHVGGELRLGLQDFQAFVTRWAANGGDDANADQKSPTDSSRTIDPAMIRPAQGSLSTKFKAQLVTPAWSPGGEDLVFVSDTGDLTRISLGSLTTSPLPSRTSGSAPGFLNWLPRPAQSSAVTTANWLLVARPQASGATAGIFRRRLDDSHGTDFPVADSLTAPEAAKMSDVTSMAISQAGTHLVFASGDSLYSCAIDGADRGLGKLARIARFASSRIVGPAIGPVRSYWSYPAANVSLYDSSQVGRFDVNAWRDFVRGAQDFDGDNKFGTQYLHVEPAARADTLMFDNGVNTYLTARADPAHAAVVQGSGLIDPCWSPRAQTYVARESSAPIPGQRPVNLFKVPFARGSATTVRITTGLEPAISPDDRFVVVSQYKSSTTTFPPDRTQFPIENMDLVLVNTSGAVDPKPRVLTPDTPGTQDREPAWSPDGRYVYYQREVQEAPSLATHGSSIYRVTADGAVQSEVQAMTPPEIAIAGVTTRLEYYSPAVSPDGTRLAMIGRERLRATVANLGDSGDIISETLYVKDLVTGGSPKAILRFAQRTHPAFKSDIAYTNETFWTLDTPSWTPDGEEIIVLRYQDNNGMGIVKYPKQTIYNWDPNGDGVPYFQDQRKVNGGDGDQEVLRVPAADPAFMSNSRPLPQNYDLLLTTKLGKDPATLDLGVTGTPDRRIFHPRLAPGAVAFQRVLYGDAQTSSIGVAMGDVWYVLSGFVRTSPGTQDTHAAQLMLQVLDGSGLLVDMTPSAAPSYRVGIVDVGALQWTRFSQAIKFFQPKNPGPYTFCLCLFSTGGVGSYAEFTGVKLERAFDTTKLFPTRFGLGWSIFTPNRDSDPRVPEGAFFER